MSSKGNTNHLRLINKLKRVKKYRNDILCLTVETWGWIDRDTETRVKLWSDRQTKTVFAGTTISELERFINKEREEDGLFIPRGARHKESLKEALNEG